MNNIDKLVDLEKKIQYKFQDFGLLEMAMRHSSYANEHHMERLECNERSGVLRRCRAGSCIQRIFIQDIPASPGGRDDEKTRMPRL